MEVVVGVVDSGRVPKEGWKGGEGWIMGRLVGFFRLAATARLSGPGMAFPSVGPAWLPRDGTGWLLLLAVAGTGRAASWWLILYNNTQSMKNNNDSSRSTTIRIHYFRAHDIRSRMLPFAILPPPSPPPHAGSVGTLLKIIDMGPFSSNFARMCDGFGRL